MDSTTRLIVFWILFALGASLAFVATLIHMAMIGEVNSRLPDQSQIGYFGGHIGKLLRVRREYLRLYPNGNLLRRFELTTAASMILCAASAAVLFRIAR